MLPIEQMIASAARATNARATSLVLLPLPPRGHIWIRLLHNKMAAQLVGITRRRVDICRIRWGSVQEARDSRCQSLLPIAARKNQKLADIEQVAWQRVDVCGIRRRSVQDIEQGRCLKVCLVGSVSNVALDNLQAHTRPTGRRTSTSPLRSHGARMCRRRTNGQCRSMHADPRT